VGHSGRPRRQNTVGGAVVNISGGQDLIGRGQDVNEQALVCLILYEIQGGGAYSHST